jgi:hypothetical protein
VSPCLVRKNQLLGISTGPNLRDSFPKTVWTIEANLNKTKNQLCRKSRFSPFLLYVYCQLVSQPAVSGLKTLLHHRPSLRNQPTFC